VKRARRYLVSLAKQISLCRFQDISRFRFSGAPSREGILVSLAMASRYAQLTASRCER
jgi:hypothetical protein